jgi:hypothetical protein
MTPPFGTEPPVVAMHARYDGWCAIDGCATPILRGHILYRVQGRSLCYAHGRQYVDSLPRPASNNQPL